ncbi:hypothetical protein GCM10022280_11720 [Sphingomonas swuensis]|uniref:Uncharacterized protein n=1 Tax=Sphingomonas swuensis TaxID=977800 RepID=A0ABP7SQ73_9SPHN
MSGYLDRPTQRRGTGIILTGCLGGPLVALEFLLLSIGASLLEGKVPLDAPSIGIVPLILAFALLFGFLPALVTAGVGTALMLALENYDPAAGSRAAWIAMGFILPAPLVLLVLLAMPSMPDMEFAAAMAMVFALPGAICAAICWRFERPSPRA